MKHHMPRCITWKCAKEWMVVPGFPAIQHHGPFAQEKRSRGTSNGIMDGTESQVHRTCEVLCAQLLESWQTRHTPGVSTF